MKVNLKATLKDKDGKPMLEGPPEARTEIILGDIAFVALGATYADEQNLSRDEKMKRGRLQMKINVEDAEVDLKAEEITLIKTCIGKGFGPWINVQCEDLLEPPSLAAVKDSA